MTIFDRRLILPGGEVDRASPYAPDSLLWTPQSGDLVLSRREQIFGGGYVSSPWGPAWERANSLYYRYLGLTGDALANSPSLTVAVIFNLGSLTLSSPNYQPIFGNADIGSGTQSGWSLDCGTGSSGTKTDLTFRYWIGGSWDRAYSTFTPALDTWYLAAYSRASDVVKFRVYNAITGAVVANLGDTSTAAFMAPGGAANQIKLNEYADFSGYLYSRFALAYVDTNAAPDLDGLVYNLLQAFRPLRPDYSLPITSHAYTGSGGITFGGGGLYTFSGAYLFEYTGSGGITFGGGQTYSKTKAPPAQTAGLVFGGAAPTAFYEGPLPYSLGATFELTSTATYTVSATFELDAPSYTVAATFELSSTTTYTVSATFDLYGTGTDAASQETSVLWQPYVTVGGVDLSARLIGGIDIDTDEMAAPIAGFTIAPTAGLVDPMAYLNATVEIWWRHMTDATTERYRRLKFSGKVLSTEWDADLALLSFDCSGDLQTKCERMTDAEVALVFAGYWSEHIFDEDADGWQKAQDRLSTTENVVWQDEAGAIRLSSIRAKTTPDFTFADSARIHETLRITHVAQRDLKNTVQITLDYRFPRKRHREIKYSWMPFAPYGGVCDYLENPFTLCTRDMVQSAADGSGWVVQGDIHYVDVWAPGLYMCGFANSEPRVWGFEDVQVTTTVDSPGGPAGTYTYKQSQDLSSWCIGAWWTSAKRWVQTITETYTLTVQAPQSIAHIGEAMATEDYGVESQASYDDWAESLGQDGPPTGGTAFTLPSGDTAIDGSADDPVNRTAMEYAQETVIAAARGDILRTHRGTTVEVEIPYHPGVTLDHTVKLDTARLVAQGKVRRIEDRLDVGSGEAITRLSLAISRKLGTGTVIDTPIAAPASAAAPTDPTFTSHVSLQTHIGGRTTSPAEDEDWTGFFSDYQYDPTATPDWSVNPANPSVVRYGTKFVVTSPDIDGDWVNAKVSAATAVYDVDIPDDTLTLTAP